MFQHQRENRALGFPGVQQLSWLQALLKSRMCVCAHFSMNIYKSNLLLVQRTNNHLTANPQRGEKSPNLQQGGQEGAEMRDARVPKPNRRSCSSSAHWGTSSWSPRTHRCPLWRRGRCSGEHGGSRGHRDTRAAGRWWRWKLGQGLPHRGFWGRWEETRH